MIPCDIYTNQSLMKDILMSVDFKLMCLMSTGWYSLKTTFNGVQIMDSDDDGL